MKFNNYINIISQYLISLAILLKSLNASSFVPSLKNFKRNFKGRSFQVVKIINPININSSYPFLLSSRLYLAKKKKKEKEIIRIYFPKYSFSPPCSRLSGLYLLIVLATERERGLVLEVRVSVLLSRHSYNKDNLRFI